MPRRPNVLTVDVEEYYHGVEFREALGAEGLARLPSRVVLETTHLLDVLDAAGARATFFTLGVVADRAPRLAREIVARGHELASHGWDHTMVTGQGREAFRLDVRRAKHALEQASGRAVRGYRTPNFRLSRETPWFFEVLTEEGYGYDSSVHPITHDRYGLPDAPRFPYSLPAGRGAAMWEVPVGTARIGRTNVPLGGGFFRLFPLPLVRHAIARVNRREGRPVVFYVHPWELDADQPRPPMALLHRVRHYIGLSTAESKLGALLAAFPFTSIERAFAEVTRPALLEASVG